MAHAFDELWRNEYAQRHQALNEAVYRSPRSLYPLTQITHIPLVNLSIEDERFSLVSSYIRYWLTNDHNHIDSLPHHATIRNIIDKNRHYFQTITIDDAQKQGACGMLAANLNRDLTNDEVSLIDEACIGICRIYINIITAQPEYLLFGCYSQIIQILHNRFSDEIRGRFASVAGACAALIPLFHKVLQDRSPEIRGVLSPLIQAASEPGGVPAHLHLGGLISPLRSFNLGYSPPSPSNPDPLLRTFDADHCEFDLYPPEGVARATKISLRWARQNQFWNYTFFESSTELDLGRILEPATRARLEALQRADLPYAALGQQDPEILTSTETSFPTYVTLLLLQGICPSILQSTTLRAITTNFGESIRFPGRLIAGAHYAFIPIGALIFILFFPAAARALAVETTILRHNVDNNALEQVSQHLKSLRRSPEYEEFLKLLTDINNSIPNSIGDAFLEQLRKSLQDQQTATVPSFRALFTLGFTISQFIEHSKIRAAKVGAILSRFMVNFWEAVNVTVSSEDLNSGRDFISCFVVDRRAIYFTNFRPIGSDRFTRTFFLDLALTAHQRGRLAERLCDISTYRSMCVRDINRIRAMVRGMDEISQELNTLEGQHPAMSAGPEDQITLAGLNATLEQLREIQLRLDQMNLWVTYGVRGRFLSVNASFSQIRERTDDIRQERISGFPMLGDFLERRVAQGVRDVQRMAERYDYLRRKVQDYYDRVRTQYTRLETSRIARFTEEANRVTSDTRKILVVNEYLSVILVLSTLALVIKEAQVPTEFYRRWVGLPARALILILLAFLVYMIFKIGRDFGLTTSSGADGEGLRGKFAWMRRPKRSKQRASTREG